jgi:thiol-disulfide isomerase/thioredoxin
MQVRFRESAARIRRLLAPLLALALALGCLLGPQTGLAADAPFSPVPGRPAAPSLALRDMDGKPVDLKKLQGNVVLVNFWATWCPPCRREMPSLQRLWQKFEKSKLRIVAVNVGEDADTVFAFMGILENSPTFPIVFDKDTAVLRAWPVKGLPTTFLIDKNGRVVYRAIGGRAFDSPESIELISELLAEK